MGRKTAPVGRSVSLSDWLAVAEIVAKLEPELGHLAMGHNLWLHFGVDEHPFATYVHQGFPGF